MKANKLIQHLLLMGAVLLLAQCCKPDDEPTPPCDDPSNPECPNYDPCYNVEEPTAKILMRTKYLRPDFGWQWSSYDSVFGYEVYFSSPYSGSDIEHTWYLGSEVIHAETFSRTHAIERPQFITVSHVITYPLDSLCFAFSAGRDSTSATYYIIEYYNELLTYSKFHGVFANETDSFTFEFKRVYPDNTPVAIPADIDSNPLFVGINFHNEGDSGEVVFQGLNLEGFFNGDGYMSPRGTLTIDSADRRTTRLEYRYLNEDFVVNARIIE